MSLVNPTVGDISDRLTILALKRLHGTNDGHHVGHFDREWAALHTMVKARTLNGAWFELVLELAAVNAELWKLTDLMRAVEEDSEVDYREAGNIGLQILHLNDRRAELVQQINELAGENMGKEKL